MALSKGKTPLFDTVNSKVPVVSGLGATATLSVDQSGSTVLLDRAAGIVVTLPLAVPGLVYDFAVTTSVTSNAYKVITGAGTELLIGTLASNDTDTSNAMAGFDGNGSTHVAVSMNGTTTGGLLGTKFRFTCLSTTRWIVEGVNRGSGTVATPFATS
jgi:hypothetical protein